MKRDKLFSLLWAVALAFCIAFGAVMCLITAFSFEADTLSLAFFCVAFAIVAAFVSMTRRGNWIFGGLLILLGVHLWRDGSLEEAVQALLYRISMIYDLAYGWGTVYWSEEAPTILEIGLALGAITVPLAWAVTWTVIRRQHSVLAIVLGLLPLCACLVVTDRVPATGSLFLLLFGLLLLVLTQTVRRQKEADGNRLTAILLIPALLCTTLLFHAIPREGYAPPQSIPGWVEGLFSGVGTGSGSGSGAPDVSLDLSGVGPKLRARYIVMEVTAEQGGVLYLRGQSYDVYDGTSWKVSEKVSGEDPYWPTEGFKDGGSVTIRLRRDQELLYLPYYTDMLKQMQFGRYENDLGKSYTVRRMVPAGSTLLVGSVSRDAVVEQCLQLPSSTKQYAQEILRTLTISGRYTDRQKAQIIGAYVQNLAVYDLNTPRMPENETDFALWFMEDAETGYCVHFATAATVLLRAAGVPARYVTGYMTDVGSGGTANVIAEESHAWVEYLDSEHGWTVLDPTPEEPEQEDTEPTRPTDDPDPTEGTDPTEPTTSQPTDPSESVDPTDTTPAETTLPDSTSTVGGGEAPRKTDLTLLWNCLMAVAYAALAVALLWGQYLLRVHLRRRRMHTGSPNQRALACWKEIVRLSRLYRQPLSEELEALADKAKFSQYTLSSAEQKVFKTRLKELSRLLAEKPWYQRLCIKLLFAAE